MLCPLLNASLKPIKKLITSDVKTILHMNKIVKIPKNQYFEFYDRKIVIIFISTNVGICLCCSKERSHCIPNFVRVLIN